MHGLDTIERDRATPVSPVGGGGLNVIESVLRFPCDDPNKSECGLVAAAARMTKVDTGGRRVICDHAAEQIRGDAADEARRRAEPRQSDGDVETGPADRGPHGLAS